ncbi:hypothetical protein C3Y87_10920 [Carbonactinospora thermoautotrophica]|uniref:Band 7 protein n=1 Tax=Carbonactinospora thermoautotrophica TaxID=1469144 RepID=A0A132MNQ3_9ACTN|nr:SPFH domain-containing protein [Carbonactinospora thermoautotrophica]KWW99497.1 Band 7 protein [Carbonactinospora thermoautotrophica]KWX04096.1 membrane protein [Carbonactinospora thermoautotrophica]MCX9191919.1 hypothetical protein [Carbonactinospora thermoautotrophica]
MLTEKRARKVSGYLAFALGLAALGALAAWAVAGHGGPATVVALGLAAVFLVLWVKGFVVVNPNEAKVLQLFGAYAGSVREPGVWWVNPLTTRRRVSLRVRSFDSDVLKVNDRDGNPIEIAAVVVWQVRDSAKAVFRVDDFEEFIVTQAETAIRHLATTYPYDAHDDLPSLRAGKVVEELTREIQERVDGAGLEIIEARISRLAYAPEIAQAMLQRQQAAAVVAARARIVEGAVGMVEAALERLNEREIVDLDEERKAAMVSNLLVVLCSDRNAQPVVNAGSLYH